MSVPYASSSLYVGDLKPEVGEQKLFEIFSTVGSVSSVRVCHDSHTRRSLGYAYVNFHKPEDADRALQTKNFTDIEGKPCRIMWSHRDPSLRKSGIGNLWIGNLDATVDNKILHDTFSSYGNILSCKVAVDENGKSLGHGFVHFETAEAADKAIKEANGIKLGEKEIKVQMFISKKSKEQDLEKTFTNVYVKNLDETIDEPQLTEMFKEFGEITRLCVMKDSEGKSRMFGFVNFKSHEAAQKAVDKLNNADTKGKKLYVGRAQKKSERMNILKDHYTMLQGSNLYIKGLDETIDDKHLAEMFQSFGTITSARIMKDEQGHSKEFGFVCFTNPEEAQRAIVEMNNKSIGVKRLYVAIAQRKDERHAMLASMAFYPPQYGSRMPQFAAPPMYYPPTGPYGVQPQMMQPRFYMPQGGMPQRGYQGQGGMPYMMSSRGGRGGRGGRMQDGGRGGYRFNNAVRNRPVIAQQPQPIGGTPILATVPKPVSDTLANLAKLSEVERKQQIGEILYPRVQALHGDLAGKITGMLLEMESSELIGLVENQIDLVAKAKEAFDVLEQARLTEAAAAAAVVAAPAAPVVPPQ